VGVEDDIFRFRCRVGHAWSAETLLDAQSSAVEAALWMALRSLEDRAALNETMAARATASGRARSAARFRSQAEEVAESTRIVRHLVHADDVIGIGGESADG
jgi:two-component system chemotaxis response regulator CheB